MGGKPRPITQEQFDLLTTTTDWTVGEVPYENWERIPGLPRRRDIVAIMGSANVTDPQVIHGFLSVAGIDVLTLETNPKQNEPEGNAYHFVFQPTNDSRFPYLMRGPFNDGMYVDHWFDAQQLNHYP